MADDLNHEFMGEIMNQLYENRQIHNDHKSRGINFMVLILIEQTGHLADALARRDWQRSRVEIFHIAAILFELFERIVAKHEKRGNAGAGEGNQDSDEVIGSATGDGAESGAVTGDGEGSEIEGDREGSGAPDTD